MVCFIVRAGLVNYIVYLATLSVIIIIIYLVYIYISLLFGALFCWACMLIHYYKIFAQDIRLFMVCNNNNWLLSRGSKDLNCFHVVCQPPSELLPYNSSAGILAFWHFGFLDCHFGLTMDLDWSIYDDLIYFLWTYFGYVWTRPCAVCC